MAKTTYINGNVAYVVSDTVGYREANRPDDVLLVQYFLSLATKVNDFERGLSSRGPLGPILTVDGSYGPKTHYWSLFFLAKHCARISESFDYSGLFEDPTKPTLGQAKGMEALNYAARKALGRAKFELLPESPATPPRLRQALMAKAKV